MRASVGIKVEGGFGVWIDTGVADGLGTKVNVTGIENKVGVDITE